MAIFWGMFYALPLVCAGMAAAVSPQTALDLFGKFRVSKAAAWILTSIAWFWTAHECDTIGIAAFDRFTKMFPGELWILACALVPLTVAWMGKNLPVRASCGILMLAPSAAFAAMRPFRPEQGVWFAPSDIVVCAAYAGAVAGMYGMFYPWRIERAVAGVLRRPRLARCAGAVSAAAGAAVAAATVCL